MGAYRQDYIGPYLIVKNKKEEIFDDKFFCINKSCDSYDKKVKTKFCPECGKEPEKVTTSKFEDYSAQDFVMNYNDCEWENELYFPHDGGVEMFKDKCIAIPNDHEDRPRYIDIDDDSSGVYPFLSEQDMLNDMNWFKEHYKHVFDKVEEEFGKENMEFGYGLVVSYS